MTLKCPECGWAYDPDAEHASRRMPPNEDCDFRKWVPTHHEPGSSLLCDGCNWFPVPADDSPEDADA